MSRYVLHHAPDNASLPVRMVLEEMGLDYSIALVDRAALGQRKPAYLALNPHGLIPVLETPQGPIFETGAILLWLTETHGVLAPAPGDPARGAFLKWLFFTANTLHADLVRLFHIERYGPPDALPGVYAASAALVAGHWARLDTGLAQDGFVGSGTPTVLDFYLGCLARWCALYPADRDRSWFNLAACPALVRAFTALEARPAVRRCAEADGMGARIFTDPVYAKPPQGSAT